MDGEEVDSVDGVDLVAAFSEGLGAAKPLEEMAHLVNHGMAVADGPDGGEDGVVDDPFRRPEDFSGRGGAVDFGKDFVGEVHAVL